MAQETLAQLIRKKYPDSYKEVSDEDLENAWLEKYPGSYDNIPRTIKKEEPMNVKKSIEDFGKPLIQSIAEKINNPVS